MNLWLSLNFMTEKILLFQIDHFYEVFFSGELNNIFLTLKSWKGLQNKVV